MARELHERALTRRSPAARWGLAVLPLLLLAGIVALFLATGAGLDLEPVAPIEDIDIQRIQVVEDGFAVTIRNTGPEPVTVAQVAVDDAYWPYTMEPEGPLARLKSGIIRIPYHWVEGEPHEIMLVTQNSFVFREGVEAAALSPTPSARTFGSFTLIGLYVGLLPVALGMLWFPFLRRLSWKTMQLVLAGTVGLLAFLFVDAVLEVFEIGAEVPAAFQGVPLGLFALLLSFLALVAVGRRSETGNDAQPGARLRVAYLIALGIGLHNLGEGLAIGTAYAFGEVALGTFLVVGFIIHNVTEGVGIVAPLVRTSPTRPHFAGLALLAGLPAVFGTWIGGFTLSPTLAVLLFGLGAGAILQVVYEVSKLIFEERDEPGRGSPLTWTNLGGLTAGLAVMYLTALLVK